jgi:hypothetical protein
MSPVTCKVILAYLIKQHGRVSCVLRPLLLLMLLNGTLISFHKPRRDPVICISDQVHIIVSLLICHLIAQIAYDQLNDELAHEIP